ncbi:MAG: CDP-alcohol phosphatidyltransferase family protein [Candidatus Woesearchaeota archaeon]|jgi:CDP-diacylglycerol--glycerol-3-phosphate 3-phosphatidyltransferase|nr:CDP-alcohol phosphatidyltransferase family protein [Candidatus Woesearchaeota archaeon]MDP7180708.1 CDP-alcohol phosphatidyltransferase family protein [Candidatus Woesearchaeota archaeon]
MKGEYFNIPNFLTMLRFIFSPVFLILFLNGETGIGLVVFAFVAITDMIDGWAARTLDQKTRFGKFIDPMADKFMIALALVSLVLKFGFPIWAIPLIVLRDVVSLTGSAIVAAKKKGPWVASRLGKLTTLFQIVTVVVFIFNFYKMIFLWIAIGFSVATAIEYGVRGMKIILSDKKKKN